MFPRPEDNINADCSAGTKLFLETDCIRRSFKKLPGMECYSISTIYFEISIAIFYIIMLFSDALLTLLRVLSLDFCEKYISIRVVRQVLLARNYSYSDSVAYRSFVAMASGISIQTPNSVTTASKENGCFRLDRSPLDPCPHQ